MTTETLFFSISGEFITTHARERMRDFDWSNALRFLITSLDGMTHEIAVEILKGEKRLTGVNDLDLCDETETVRSEWQKIVHKMFGAVTMWNDYYWQPYAVVDNFGMHDLSSYRLLTNLQKSSNVLAIPSPSTPVTTTTANCSAKFPT